VDISAKVHDLEDPLSVPVVPVNRDHAAKAVENEVHLALVERLELGVHLGW